MYKIDSGNHLPPLSSDVWAPLRYSQVPFDLTEVCVRVLDDLCHGPLGRGIDPRIEIDPSLPRRFVGDPVDLRRSVIGLVSQSVRRGFSGILTVRIEPDRGSGPVSRLRVHVRELGHPPTFFVPVYEPAASSST